MFSFNANLKGQNLAVVIIAVAIFWVLISLGLAFPIDYAFDKFGAEWSDYWGWVVLLAITPVLRVWILGNK